MTVIQRIGFTVLESRADGIAAECRICGRDTHCGAKIETIRETNDRRISLFACYDCIEVCHLIAVGRMPCPTCHGNGTAPP